MNQLRALKPEQLNMEFLMGLTRQAGDGYQFDGSSMLGEGVFFFKKIGEAIQLVEKNTKFRAKESRAIYKSVKNHIFFKNLCRRFCNFFSIFFASYFINCIFL